MSKVRSICSKELVSTVDNVRTALDDVCEAFGVDSSINQKMLLHGTMPDRILPIIQNGMNENMCAGTFGNGVYLAEVADKVDQYCASDKPGSGLDRLHMSLYSSWGKPHLGNVYYAFVCRCILGCPITTKDGHVSMVDGARVFNSDDRRELPGIRGTDPPIHYHSLIVEAGPASEGYALARHREFVIFRAQQILPEILVAYRRQ